MAKEARDASHLVLVGKEVGVVAGGWQDRVPVFVVVGIGCKRDAHLADVGEVGTLAGGVARFAKSREQDADEQRDNRDHHEQFDQREAGNAARCVHV